MPSAVIASVCTGEERDASRFQPGGDRDVIARFVLADGPRPKRCSTGQALAPTLLQVGVAQHVVCGASQTSSARDLEIQLGAKLD